MRLCRGAQLCAHEVDDRLYAAGDFDGLRRALSGLYERGLVEQVGGTDGRLLPRTAKAVWKVSEKGKCLSEEKASLEGPSASRFGE